MGSAEPSTGIGSVRGVIRRRLLVNALVDPDEARSHLPDGIRPHATEAGTVVGCCLLDLGGLRPMPLPASAGVTMRAAAHRISVEWDESGEVVVGVYVPMRHTSSRLAVALGGRVFPGAHRRARVSVVRTSDLVRWDVSGVDNSDRFDIHVEVETSRVDYGPVAPDDVVGATCIGASVGLSPDRHGVLEAARMEPESLDARRVELDELRSEFIEGFVTAEAAPTYLMEDVAVRWSPAVAPPVGVDDTVLR